MWDLPIDPNSDEFEFFLNWLIDEKEFGAKEIVDVVYGSHKYRSEMKEYLNQIGEKNGS